MNFFRFAPFVLLPVAAASAQSASDPNESLRLSIDTETEAWTLSWWGVDARTYFIQHTEELGNPTLWNFLPVIEQGAGAPVQYGFWLSPIPPRVFFRLKYSDVATSDPYAADFDGDGIPNGWEIEHGLDPFDASDAAKLNNGLSNLELYQQSLGEGGDPATANPVGLVIFTP